MLTQGRKKNCTNGLIYSPITNEYDIENDHEIFDILNARSVSKFEYIELLVNQ